MTEGHLIERASRGDRRAIRQLYERHAPHVFAIVCRMSGDRERARDHAQEVWMRAIGSLPDFRGEARFSTWLHRIAVNVVLESARREAVRAAREVPVPESLSEGPPTSDALLERRLEEALGRLPEGMRRTLVLHEIEGLTHEEIADLLGVTVGTSKSQLFRARARMRELLTKGSLSMRKQGVER